MKIPNFISNLGVAIVPQLINSLNDNPNFEDYLSSIKFCLENKINIDPLKQWWDNNHQNLAYTDVVIEYASLLEHIQITNKTVPITQTIREPTLKKTPKYKYIPWTNTWIEIPNKNPFDGADDFLLDYNKYLERFAPLNATQSKLVIIKIAVTAGTQEQKHLAEIGVWVSTKIKNKDIKFVFHAILKTHSDLVLHSGKVFKAACLCPHKLFRIFMESDFSGYDLENGDALSHLLSLPIAINPDDNGSAHLTPDYPFFNNNIFTEEFRISPALQLSLAGAWKEFYLRYKQLCETQNDKRTFVGGGELFALTVESLTNSKPSLTGLELTNILHDTEPNLWCIQYWLHCIILETDSIWLKSAYFYNAGEHEVYLPDFVDYFFCISEYIYDKGISELSSRLLIAGIIQVFYWSRNELKPAETIFQKYFPVFFNHRRTQPITQITKYINNNLDLFYKNTNNVFFQIPNFSIQYISRLLDYEALVSKFYKGGDISYINSVGQSTGSIKPNNPCFITYDLKTFKTSPDHDYESIATILANIIGACLNSNGGDIFLKIPAWKTRPEEPNDFYCNALENISDSHQPEIITVWSWGYRKKYLVYWLRCDRSSRPAYTNIDNVLSLPVPTSSCENPKILYGADADNYVSQHFPLHDQVQPIVLTIYKSSSK